MASKDIDSHLLAVLSHLLTPLVRFLLRSGFTYPRLIQLLRQIYVDLAEQKSVDDKPVTTSRVSLLTGIARRYIREIRLQDKPASYQTPKMAPGAKLVAEWITLSEYSNEDGIPKALPRLTTEANTPSFAQLAELASADIRPRTQLQHLLERGLVRLDDDDMVHLLTPAYQPDGAQEELMSLLADHLHDHISTVASNISGDRRRQLDRSAYQNGLSAESIKELEEYSERQAMDMLKRVYTRARALKQRDENNTDTRYRFRLGVYAHQQKIDKDNRD